MYKFSARSMTRMENVNPKLIAILYKALELSPIDFGIPEDGGYRYLKDQERLYKNGASKCDGRVKKSKHQTGDAIDIYAWINGHSSWDKTHLAIIAGVILAVAKDMDIDLVWGGTFGSTNFRGWDYGHFELA